MEEEEIINRKISIEIQIPIFFRKKKKKKTSQQLQQRENERKKSSFHLLVFNVQQILYSMSTRVQFTHFFFVLFHFIRSFGEFACLRRSKTLSTGNSTLFFHLLSLSLSKHSFKATLFFRHFIKQQMWCSIWCYWKERNNKKMNQKHQKRDLRCPIL